MAGAVGEHEDRGPRPLQPAMNPQLVPGMGDDQGGSRGGGERRGGHDSGVECIGWRRMPRILEIPATGPKIARYLCEKTIHPALLDRVNEGMGEDGQRFESVAELLLRLDARLSRKLLAELLPSFTILDPACGSGVLLVAALETLAEIYRAVAALVEPVLSRGEIRRRILRHNLFGVDLSRRGGGSRAAPLAPGPHRIGLRGARAASPSRPQHFLRQLAPRSAARRRCGLRTPRGRPLPPHLPGGARREKPGVRAGEAGHPLDARFNPARRVEGHPQQAREAAGLPGGCGGPAAVPLGLRARSGAGGERGLRRRPHSSPLGSREAGAEGSRAPLSVLPDEPPVQPSDRGHRGPEGGGGRFSP